MRKFQEPVTTGRSLPVGHLEYSSCVGAKVAEAVPLRTQCAQWGIRHVRADFVTRGTLSEVGPDYVVVIRSDLKTCIGITSPLKCPADSTLPEDRECSVCLNAQIPSCLAHKLLPTLSTLSPSPYVQSDVWLLKVPKMAQGPRRAVGRHQVVSLNGKCLPNLAFSRWSVRVTCQGPYGRMKQHTLSAGG